MDLFVLSFFVLVNNKNIDLIETPEILEKYEKFAYDMYKGVIEEQLYLMDLGVSFSYTDTIDAQTRRDLLTFVSEWRQTHENPNKLL